MLHAPVPLFLALHSFSGLLATDLRPPKQLRAEAMKLSRGISPPALVPLWYSGTSVVRWCVCVCVCNSPEGLGLVPRGGSTLSEESLLSLEPSTCRRVKELLFSLEAHTPKHTGSAAHCCLLQERRYRSAVVVVVVVLTQMHDAEKHLFLDQQKSNELSNLRFHQLFTVFRRFIFKNGKADKKSHN